MVRLFQKGVQHGLKRVGRHGVVVLQRFAQRHVHAQVLAALNGQQEFGQFVWRVVGFVGFISDALAQSFCQVRTLQILAQRHQPVARNGEPMIARQEPNGAFHRQKWLHAGKQVELAVRHRRQFHQYFALNGFYGVVWVYALIGVLHPFIRRRIGLIGRAKHNELVGSHDVDRVNWIRIIVGMFHYYAYTML